MRNDALEAISDAQDDFLMDPCARSANSLRAVARQCLADGMIKDETFQDVLADTAAYVIIAGNPTTADACDHSEWGPACAFCGEAAIPIFDKDVIAIVEALIEHERRNGRATHVLTGDGVTSLPALRVLIDRYEEIKTPK